MKDFQNVAFKGTFRHYQQKVLDNAQMFLNDGKIHIVAAPGSGKTTLGIELIKTLNQPAIVLSPSITIRSQWGKRFDEGFLNDTEDVNEYVSYNLKEPKLITSITYQGLHSAFHKLIDEDQSENEIEEEKVVVDYSNFDLIKMIRKHGIKTICLDEAHHLRSEWYKTLTTFIHSIEDEVIIIALTATPPYDSTPQEWARYEGLCGEIDDEIFVPELIKKNNLCPHQDYIYFNYPVAEEQQVLDDYQNTVTNTLRKILQSDHFKAIINDFVIHYNKEKYNLYEHIEYYITLGTLTKKMGHHLPYRLRSILKGRELLQRHRIQYVEQLLEFIIREPVIFTEVHSKFIQDTLKENGLIERKKVNLNKSSSLKKQVISSIGKLNSIGEIARFESDQLKESLQMLILTDYIKKDMIDTIGKNEEVRIMGAVPIFEKVRQSVQPDVRIALLSGSLVIVPERILDSLSRTCDQFLTKYKLSTLANTPYSIVHFQGSNKQRVHIITLLFEAGDIDILIGTKSLLGEGWDSPCINTLILASFVGSYMLSNQMRGRAIRIDKNNPDKVANIWHLATVERNRIVGSIENKLDVVRYIQESKTIVSTDYEMLDRRFKSFLGPAYIDDYISSGIERIDYIKPPFNQERFELFNNTTKEYAKNRSLVRDKWVDALQHQDITEILDQSEIDDDTVPYGIIIYDGLLFSSSSFAIAYFFSRLLPHLEDSFFTSIILLILLFIYSSIIYRLIPRIILNLGPSKRIKSLSNALLQTLKEMGVIQSKGIHIKVKRERRSGYVYSSLANATRHEKAVFTSSLKEMLSKIENPRYLIIKRIGGNTANLLLYSETFVVPKIIGVNKQNVELLQNNLKFSNGQYEVVYTRSETGRKMLLKAKKRSNINRISSYVLSRRIVNES